MKMIKIFIAIFLLTGTIIKSQAQFQKTYGLEGDDIGKVLLSANDSSLYMIGALGYIYQIDTAGDIIWEKVINHKDDFYFNMLTDAINTDYASFVLLGNSYHKGGNQESVFIVEISSNGDTLWSKSYGDLWSYYNGNNIIPTKDGGFAIIGNGSLNDFRNRNLLLIRTDSIGNLLWSKTYGGNSNDVGICLSETESGDLILVGRTESYGEEVQDIYILRIDSEGDTIWTKTIGGNRNDYPSDIVKTSSNEFVLTGTTSSYGERVHDDDLFLLKINDDGNIIWSHTYGGSGDESGQKLIQTTDSCYLVIGNTNSFGYGQEDIFLIKTDDFGDTLFTKVYGGSSVENGRYITDAASGYYLLGETRSFSVGEKDMCMISIDEEGISSCRYSNTYSMILEPEWKENSGTNIGEGCDEERTNLHLADINTQVNNMCDCIQPIAKFRADPVDGSVDFEDLSTWSDTWYWDFGDGEYSYEQNTEHFFLNAVEVCLTVENSCGSDTYCEIVYGGGGVEEMNQHSLITIFPNPTKEIIQIKFNNSITIKSIKIFTLLGSEILDINYPNQNPYNVDLSNIARGIYMIRIITQDNKSMIKEIIIE